MVWTIPKFSAFVSLLLWAIIKEYAAKSLWSTDQTVKSMNDFMRVFADKIRSIKGYNMKIGDQLLQFRFA